MTTPRLILANLAVERLSTEPEKRLEQTATIMAALTEAFAARGLGVVLVGGSAIEVWAPGAHISDDTDVVVTGPETGVSRHDQAAEVMRSLGFRKQGLGWALGGLYVHVVDDRMNEPTATVELGRLRFTAVQPEVPLADRMIGFKHWPNTTSYGQQAIAMLESLGEDLDEAWLCDRLAREGARDVLGALRALAASGQPITEEVLSRVQKNLRAERPWDAVEPDRGL